MPRGAKPKKQSGAAKKREKERKSTVRPAKIREDKTFGLKNKNKSKRVQTNIRNIRNNEKVAGKTADQVRRDREREEQKKERKLMAQKQKEEQNLIMFGNKAGKSSDGSVGVCPFFLKGSCRKGKKCRFSHAAAKGGGALSLYVDARDDKKKEKEKDNMTEWDQETLEKNIAAADAKHRPPNQTEIICRYFLDAVEKKLYGHFWVCENEKEEGKSCKYRHRLPQGFVLRSEQTLSDIDRNDTDAIAADIEEKRKKLDLSKCTPLTFELFQKWRSERKTRLDEEQEEARRTAAKKKGGRANQILSGRRLFEFDPTLFQDDAGAAGADDLELAEEDTTQDRDLTPEALAAEAKANEEKKEGKVPTKSEHIEGKKKRRKKKKRKAAWTGEGEPPANTATDTTPATAPTADAPAPAAAPTVVGDASLFLEDMDEPLPDSDED